MASDLPRRCGGLGTWRGRPLGQAQKASGPWNLPGGAPDPSGITPQTPKTAKNVCFGHFSGTLAGSPPSDRRRRPRVPGFCQPGAPDPPAWYPPHLQKPKIGENWQGRPSDRHRRPRVPGFCQPGAPDPPGGSFYTFQKCQKCMFWQVFEKNWQGRPSDRPRRPRVPGICQPGAPDPPGGTPPDPPTHTQKTKATQWSWVWGPSLLPNGKRSIAGLSHYSPRIPGGFTLPHRSDGTLGRGLRSEPRAPMQMVSGALGSLGV